MKNLSKEEVKSISKIVETIYNKKSQAFLEIEVELDDLIQDTLVAVLVQSDKVIDLDNEQFITRLINNYLLASKGRKNYKPVNSVRG